MKLNLNHFKQITTGAVNIVEEDEKFSFCRFTKEQQDLYQNRNQLFYDRTFSPAGIKFSFKTDSKKLFIKLKASYLSSLIPVRNYFSVDVYVNKKSVGYIDNFSDLELERDYTQREFALGEFSKTFMLGDGEKQVCIHLPWSVRILIEEISVDDNAFIESIKPKKKLLAFGDSITQGFDALRPSNRYTARLADKLDAEEFNKGIGGEGFFPELSELKDPFVPDYITVAYGTNDWNGIDKETFQYNCKTFFDNLSKNYPDSKIFAITPIWRKDHDEERLFGAFETVERYIRELVEQNQNTTLVTGYDLVPQDENYFADLRLHPNDNGFGYYAENLYRKIKPEIL